MFGRRKILISGLIVLLCVLHNTEAVVSLGLVFALTPGAAAGGLVTGIIGVVLGGVSIAVALDKLDLSGDRDKEEKKKKEEEQVMMNMMKRNRFYPQQASYNRRQQQRYGQRRRYKRNPPHFFNEKVTMEKLQLESFLDKVYVKDTSQCLEKLICSISKRMNQGALMSPEENDVLNIIQHNLLHGYMYKKMLVSHKVGNAGGDCEFLYSSCPLRASHMLYYIRESSRRIEHSMR